MRAAQTSIPGVWRISLDVHADDRGSFREAFHRANLEKFGVPVIEPVQLNVSASRYGVIRGIHAEPWDKYTHVTAGQGFAAIVDLRSGTPGFGTVETFELGEGDALYIPSGCGNSIAAVSEHLAYAYLVPQHWDPDQKYTAVAYDDPDLAIDWPIPPEQRVVSEKDQQNPKLKELS